METEDNSGRRDEAPLQLDKRRNGERRLKFSVVVPAHPKDIGIMPKTLPSYLALKPDEMLLCLDEPIPQDFFQIVAKITDEYSSCYKLRIVPVPKDSTWKDQQMRARRTGFMNAKNDRILTGDIDLVVNRNVFKALELLGKDDIGLVSCTKFRYPSNFLHLLRLMGENFLKLYVHRFVKGLSVTTFSGLYAIWRPFWKDSEPIEEARNYSMVKRKIRDGQPLRLSDLSVAGEDTFLRDHMMKKRKVVYLPNIGGYVTSDPLDDTPLMQYVKGIYFSTLKERSDIVALFRAFTRIQPYYFAGHIYGKQLKKLDNLEKIKIDLQDFSNGK